MLINEAGRHKIGGATVWRSFARCLLEAGDLTFRKFMGFKVPKEDIEGLAWLRDALMDPDAIIGPIQVQKHAKSAVGSPMKEKEFAA